VAMGTDAGNPLTLHGPAVYAEMEAMQAAGMSPMAVLVASTRGGARAMGRETEFGTVQAGKDADLLLVGADPTRDIRAMRRLLTVVRGGIVHRPADYRAAPAR
jgi:imidazolonepropionase-like amidohydrolase